MKTGALLYAFHFIGEKVPGSLRWSPFGVYWLEEHHLPSRAQGNETAMTGLDQ